MMNRLGFKWSDTGSYLMIAIATSVFVSTHLPHRGAASVPDAPLRSSASVRDVGAPGQAAPEQRCMRSSGVHNGVFHSGPDMQGPCLMVRWAPLAVPPRHRSVGMV
jgi:hypothetical protein